MITVLADRFIPYLEEIPGPDIRLMTFDPVRGPTGQDLLQADALIVRTVTRINGDLLDKAPRLSIVVSASAGYDHINIDDLEKRGIAFSYAPGCNAAAVSEYVATSILLWNQNDSAELTCGIVGAGHAGTRVMELLERLGIQTVAYDPPRHESDPDFTGSGLEQVLGCDVLTLHVPLTMAGPWTTLNWLDEKKIRSSRARLFINTSRGGVADEEALVKCKKETGADYILDVWKNEPLFNDEAARLGFLSTPHIAGYSRQSKHRAAIMSGIAVQRHFGIANANAPQSSDRLPPAMASTPVSVVLADGVEDHNLEEILCHLHPVCDYDRRFQKLIGKSPEEKSDGFIRLRARLPLRDEFTVMKAESGILGKNPILKKLGIQ